MLMAWGPPPDPAGPSGESPLLAPTPPSKNPSYEASLSSRRLFAGLALHRLESRRIEAPAGGCGYRCCTARYSRLALLLLSVADVSGASSAKLAFQTGCREFESRLPLHLPPFKLNESA